jgi:hypothetical protein
MSDRERRDAQPLLVLAAAIASTILVSRLPWWIDALAGPSVRPILATLAGALVVFASSFLIARAVCIRRGLRNRSTIQLLPAPSFDPSDEAVLRFASSLSRSRRVVRGLLDGPASAVRVRLDDDEKARLRYAVELPTRARAALAAAAAAFGEVELRDISDERTSAGVIGEREVARAELVLARASAVPLRAAGLDPDPLVGFARALQGLKPSEGDVIEVCVDLLPVIPARRRRLRRRLLRKARHQLPAGKAGAREWVPDLLAASGDNTPPPAELVGRRADHRALTDKLGSPEPLFEIQVLVRVASPIPGRAKARLLALLTAFDVFAGENHLRVSGLRIPGVAFLGSDLPGRRGRFDRRLRSGLFAPARRRVVTATEIAGLLKPPTVKCSASQVARSIGAIPAAPDGLPTFTDQDRLLPLGKVETESGERVVGVPLADTFFSYMAGRSRWGKTETAIGQFIHLARAGHGCFFLDPHEDGLQKIKGYLTEEGIRERVVEVNLARPSGRQLGWNLFAVKGRSASQAQGQVDAVVDAIASTMRWDEHNTRALNLTTQAAQGLIELARHLPPELAPTIFQIPTLLGNGDWREAVLPYLSAPTKQFFVERFPLLSEEAITPVTNLIDRLRAAPGVAALLGNPRSSYDVRRAMDEGKIVLVCPGEGSTRDRLLANFFVYDLLHAAKSRRDLQPEERRPFYAFLDEVQTYDGASSGNLAALLEQTAKYGARAFLFNQNPERLTPATLEAVTTNRSHLISTALGAKAAALVAREWAGSVEPETIVNLPRYSSIASVTLDGEISKPFLLRGVPASELFPDGRRPEELPELEKAMGHGSGRQPIKQTLAGLERHDQAILAHLARGADGADRDAGRGGELVMENGE